MIFTDDQLAEIDRRIARPVAVQWNEAAQVEMARLLRGLAARRSPWWRRLGRWLVAAVGL